MVTLRQRPTVATTEPEPVLENCVDDLTILSDDEDSPSDAAVKHLRGSWELASVLNFLNVFRPLISENLKVTAEEIEMGIIDSDATNAQLHIALLKGIPPVNNKSLEDGDAWITALCKKLDPWWPSIANGEIPLTANKGGEISGYKGLDSTDRLQFLKALCELRAQQDDARKYIQENANEGALNPCFGKRKLGGDGKKTSYWFDGNDILGYRLYKEVNEVSKSAKARKNVFSDASCFCWETEATNLDEFQRVARELSSSKSSSLAAVGKTIETDAIPVVEKFHKKKERAIKKKMRQEMFVSANISRPIRFTRSCRNRKPVIYTFDEYDKMITDAVEDTDETDRDDEEGIEQQSDVSKTEEGAPESDNGDVKEIEKSKEDSEEKIQFGAKNRMRQRLTRNSALC
ncbi:PREDICTED: uncharacterized protein LOC106306467 isoform X2 [Brassica oleracea var. oleracea]|uniref:uncharacterized protein LOC106306467 isoform X2 n=1 Tax=Brassica oleracea var. oleracea TaxID=109376 RepID=UPI0006A6D1FE|nr:PREDICTED: uncharacterized protein LOC106306467 isoform X2 [Brassica oleracea var. oleracea]